MSREKGVWSKEKNYSDTLPLACPLTSHMQINNRRGLSGDRPRKWDDNRKPQPRITLNIKKKVLDSPRRSETQTLKECIDAMINQYRLRGKFNQVNLVASWERIMGKTVASRTNKIFFKEKTLFVQISSAPLKHQLSMSKSRIVELVNKEFEDNLIDEVVFI